MPDLSHLKAGDQVLVESNLFYCGGPVISHDLLKIIRVTKNFIVCEKGRRFRRLNGMPTKGSAYYCAEEATEDKVVAHNEQLEARQKYKDQLPSFEEMLQKLTKTGE